MSLRNMKNDGKAFLAEGTAWAKVQTQDADPLRKRKEVTPWVEERQR